jgi:type II restriction enzyme
MSESKAALDHIINISRAHMYKPIQIGEILYRSRVYHDFDIKDLDSYRNDSKRWRDEISLRLVGNVSTSSQKYQDNIFEENALPLRYFIELDKINKEKTGIVENYIYFKCAERWRQLLNIKRYIEKATPDTFEVRSIVKEFDEKKGLKRSIDKIYEITVYSLFSTIIEELKVMISLEIENPDKDIMKDFNDFISMVLGIKLPTTKIISRASLYRAGVANAADLGIDIFTNYGPIVQVKHLSLSTEIVEDIVEKVDAEKIIIVCDDAEKTPIQSLLSQLGWRSRIQGIITLADIIRWYDLCLHKYNSTMGIKILKNINREFNREFPLVDEIDKFLEKRHYDISKLKDEWKID